ncbi:MAG: CobW family GTP-binding protein [Butyricicoccaceae bacterium]
MTKIDIISGFLGSGKTTLIKKLLEGPLKGKKVVLIENEFGEIGIDGGFLKDAGIEITEMNSGCICCSLVGDFGEALRKVLAQFTPDRIIIEPSGVGKLSDVAGAVSSVLKEGEVELGCLTTVADASKCRMYIKNFGEFYNNQLENAQTIVLSRTQKLNQKRLDEAVAMVKEHAGDARIITTPWDQLTGEQIFDVMCQTNAELLKVEDVCPVCGHDHHDHEHHHHDGEECSCGHHHDHDHDHEHHHHHDGEECSCGHHHDHDHHHDSEECSCGHHHDHDHEHEHEHHHHDGETCSCGHDHHHHHGHDADEVFTSWGIESTRKYAADDLKARLEKLADADSYGIVLRAKGIVPAEDGTWLHFDLVPEEIELRTGSADYTGRLCVIGSKLNETALAELFA